MNVELQYLFAGFAVFWGGLLVYLVLLQARLRSLREEVTRLEERLAEPISEARADTAGVASRVAPRANV